MAGVILTCGRLGVGKTTYAQTLRREMSAAVLSVDEIMLALFGGDAGPMHDEYAAKLTRYVYEKAAELAEAGVTAVVDAGLWARRSREEARAFFATRNIPCEIHYLDVDEATRLQRVEARNRRVLAGEETAYVVDEGLACKADALFEPPAPEEVDRHIKVR